MELGKRLSRLLEERGKSAAELARFLNTKQSTVSGWVNAGRVPNSEVIIPICEFLNITPYQLLTDNGDGSDMLAVIGNKNVVGNKNSPISYKEEIEPNCELTEQEKEILRIYKSLSVKEKAKLLLDVCKYEEENNK